MKYTLTIEIALPRKKVLQLLEDSAHRPMWLRGLVLHELRKGAEGQVGAESRIVFQSGKKEMELIETITRREPNDLHDVAPDCVVHFEREIVADGMWSAAREQLSESGPESTLWKNENEFRFSGFKRFLAPFLRHFFIKQSRQVLQDFKSFAERGTDVRKESARPQRR